ncbi:MAG: N-acetylmuramoyl-L-alanine amidase [Ignavibacteriales bacterium]|nr:N-acetylmuramoyl-L-alanine amidase [Ignavibacteriales bacterium]
MKLFWILFFTILLAFQSFAQDGNNVLVVTKDGMKNIPAYVREATIYFSLKDFADVLGVNYYYNDEAQKIEVKFDKYFVKASARNPFLILSEKNGDKQIAIQLPTSTYLINNKVYVPLKYSLKPLEMAYGKELSFNSPNKIVIGKIKDERTDTSRENPSAFNITGMVLNEKANGTLITLKSNKRIPSYLSAFKNNVLTLTFRKVSVDVDKVNYIGTEGVVKKVESKNVGADAVINITMGKEYTTNEVMNIEQSNDIQITIHNKLFNRTGNSNKFKEKWEFDVIVIDAGHGGKDAGAIGVNGVKEKDINLAIALKLGKLIQENMKDVKVVYTRKTDVFIDLYKRGKIANENNGKLFISIHCNSIPKKTKRCKWF